MHSTNNDDLNHILQIDHLYIFFKKVTDSMKFW
jgi:hypothetical protein